MGRIPQVMLSVGAAVILTASGLGASSSASAQIAPARPDAARCMVKSYLPRHHVKTLHHKPLVTHATQFRIPPGGRVTSKRAKWRRTVRAHASSELNVNGRLAWLWRAVNRRFQVTVHRAGAHTVRRGVTVRITVPNRAGHSRVYVAYTGVTEYYGKAYVTYCGHTDATGHGIVARRTRAYTNFLVLGGGIAWCGGRATSTLVREAINEYCP